MPEISYRTAVRGDIELILKFIRDLAEYEHLAGEVVAEPGVLADWLFEKRVAKVVFVMCDGRVTGELDRKEASQELILELAMSKSRTGQTA